MKIQLPTKLLASALAQIRAVAKPSRDHAILGNVAFIAEKKALRLIGTDGEKRLEIAMSCKVKEPGSITLNCQKLHDVIKEQIYAPEFELSTTDETKEIKGEKVRVITGTIKIGRHTGSRQGLPLDEMPAYPTEEGAHKFTIPAALLKEALSKCAIQAGGEGERAYMNSVWIVSRDGLLNVQATDGKREIIFYTPVPLDVKDAQFVIPKESIPMIVALSEGGDLEIEMSESILTVATDGARFSTKLLEAPKLDFLRPIPSDDKLTRKFTANREEMITDIKTAAGYLDEAVPQLGVNAKDGELRISGNGKGQGECNGGNVTKCEGDEIQFYCNPSNLIDALNAFADESVTLHFQDAISPFVIKNDLITSVVYPMRPA